MTDSVDVRDQAIARLKSKRHFWMQFFSWIVLSALFVVIWLATGMGGFWPIWPIAAIAIGVAFSAVRTFGPGSAAPTESQIQDEIRRMS